MDIAMSETESISAKLEDYLEAIFGIVAENRVARVSDIAARMGVQMPTVTGALKHLAEHGLVNYEPYQYVTLTDRGIEIARNTTRRHRVLKRFMTDVLGLSDETAEQDACGMEHAVSQETLDGLSGLLESVDQSRTADSGEHDAATDAGNDNPASEQDDSRSPDAGRDRDK